MTGTAVREQPNHQVPRAVRVGLAQADRREARFGVRRGRRGQHLADLTFLVGSERRPPAAGDHPTGWAAAASSGCASLILRRAILPLAIRSRGSASTITCRGTL